LYDDSIVHEVGQDFIARHDLGRKAYLLFYALEVGTGALR